MLVFRKTLHMCYMNDPLSNVTTANDKKSVSKINMLKKLTPKFPCSVDCSLLFSQIYVVDGLSEPKTALSFEGLNNNHISYKKLKFHDVDYQYFNNKSIHLIQKFNCRINYLAYQPTGII